MNYFELFGIPVQLKPDKQLVKKKYFELSKKSHPDYFINSSSTEQQTALDDSATLNKALKTLSNADETVKYVLMMKGILEEEEKYSLPPAFLMQMMDINETVDELQFDDDPGKIRALHTEFENLQNEIYAPVKSIIENYSEGITTEKELLQVKEFYFKKKYINRLQQQLKGKL